MKHKLSPAEQDTVDYLIQNPGANSLEFAEKFGLKKITASARLSTMWKQKILLRTPTTGNMFGYQVTSEYGGGKPSEVVKVTTPAPIPVPAPQKHQILELAVTEKAVSTPIDGLVNSLVECLADEVVKRLRPLIIKKLGDEVKAISYEVAQTSVPESAPLLKRILVCGVLPQQGSMLQQEFKGVADVRFVTKDDRPNKWKSNSASADHVIVMTDFVSHHSIREIESVGVKPVLCAGGMTSMRDKLMELSVS